MNYDWLVHAWTFIVSIVTAVFAFVFDVPIAWVFAAFSGAYAGVFFGDPVSRKMSIGLVIAGTFIGGWGVSILLHNPQFINLESGNYAARAIASALAFIGVHFRKQIHARIESIINWRHKI